MSLTVNGIEHKISVEKVGRITVKGANNTVEYDGCLKGKEPKTSNEGVDNKITKKKSASSES